MESERALPFRSCLAKEAHGALQRREGWLTPYEVEILFADAAWAGAGAALEVAVPASTSEDGIAWIRDRFDPLRRRGVVVRVERDDGWSFHTAGREPRSTAAGGS